MNGSETLTDRLLVDHTAPHHDDLCRCVVCKPSLLERKTAHQVLVACAGLGLLATAGVAVWL